MRLSTVAFFMILTTVFLSACSSDKLAAVEERGGNYYGRNGIVSATPQAVTVAAATSAPAAPASNDIAAQYAALAKPQAAPQTGTWQWPVNGQVTEKFGQKSEGVVNEGIVIAAPEGTPIKAAQAGEVAFVGKDTKNYGNIVILRHPNGDMTSYAHAKSIIVTKGERVADGATIGFVGKSGNAKAPQLHFALREGRTSVDPLSKLPHTIAMN